MNNGISLKRKCSRSVAGSARTRRNGHIRTESSYIRAVNRLSFGVTVQAKRSRNTLTWCLNTPPMYSAVRSVTYVRREPDDISSPWSSGNVNGFVSTMCACDASDSRSGSRSDRRSRKNVPPPIRGGISSRNVSASRRQNHYSGVLPRLFPSYGY